MPVGVLCVRKKQQWYHIIVILKMTERRSIIEALLTFTSLSESYFYFPLTRIFNIHVHPIWEQSTTAAMNCVNLTVMTLVKSLERVIVKQISALVKSKQQIPETLGFISFLV